MKRNKFKFPAIFLSLLMLILLMPANVLAAVPTAPTDFTAIAASSSQIDLTWTDVDGATSYYVYRATSSSGSYEKIATTEENTYTSTGLCASSSYYYKLKAHNTSGTSAYTSYKSATTAAPADGVAARPENLEADAVGTDEIDLTWDPVEDAVSYYVYRGTTSSSTSKIATVKLPEYKNTGLTAGKKYYYQVASYNPSGTSAKSTYDSATTDTDVPEAPDNLEATALSSSQIKLTWDAASGATSYYVYRATSSTGTYSKIATVTDEAYTNSSLKAGTTYYYKVAAVNSDGASEYSTKAYATTKTGSSTTSSDGQNTYRLSGTDRYATAAAIVKDGWTTSNYAVIASGEDFPDALCGAPLAAKYDAPILLTSKNRLEDQTKTQLTRLGVEDVFIIGGTGVISSAVEQTIENMGINVTRIAGSDRYETALMVAKKIGTFDLAIITTGENFPDALSIASVAGMKGYPILLTENYRLRSDVLTYLESKVDDTLVVGGTGVVSNSVYSQLPSPVRLSGTDRYATNLAIIKYFESSLNFGTCYVATGENYPDALSGSALAALNSAPVFLVSSAVSQSALTFMDDQSIQYVTAFGGTSVVSSTVLNSMASNANGSALIPDAPESLDATAVSPTEIYLNWDSVTDADGYYIYRATSSSGTYTKIDTEEDSQYTDYDLSANKSYYYQVKAYNDYGTSAYSNKAYDTTEEDYVLDTVEGFTATMQSSCEILLAWDPVTDADSYYVYRASSSTGEYFKIKTVSDGETYTDNGLNDNTTYYYKVMAYSSDGSGDYSDKAYAKTALLSVPTGIDAATQSASEILLTWNPVNYATAYYVYKSTSPSSGFSKIATVTDETYSSIGLTSGKTYYYKIQAYDGENTSTYSSTVNDITN